MSESLYLSTDPEADRYLTGNPLALLIGMVLDQQVPLEKAFHSPLDLRERLGHEPDAAELASFDPEALATTFAQQPALHRFPGSMAKRVQAMCAHLVEHYGGEATRLWETADNGDELLKRVKALPGFGEQKARIFVALLGKQLGVQPPGWQEAAGEYGQPGTTSSVADIVDADSLARVRAYKAQKKAAAKAAK